MLSRSGPAVGGGFGDVESDLLVADRHSTAIAQGRGETGAFEGAEGGSVELGVA